MLPASVQEELQHAIRRYDYPAVTRDFVSGAEKRHGSMRSVEAEIRSDLLGDSSDSIRNGLSNVLYWGYYRSPGIRDCRVRRFREGVSRRQVCEARALFRRLSGPGIIAVKKLGLPEFSQMSFVSKVRMFLWPVQYVVLDRKLLRIRDQPVHTVLHTVKLYSGAEYIPITHHNEDCYERWCALCRRLADENFPSGEVRAVDVERGVFSLVGSGELALAAAILADS